MHYWSIFCKTYFAGALQKLLFFHRQRSWRMFAKRNRDKTKRSSWMLSGSWGQVKQGALRNRKRMDFLMLAPVRVHLNFVSIVYPFCVLRADRHYRIIAGNNFNPLDGTPPSWVDYVIWLGFWPKTPLTAVASFWVLWILFYVYSDYTKCLNENCEESISWLFIDHMLIKL